jgi:Fungal Zn(2)-Cys(6) binuclear cluster domain
MAPPHRRSCLNCVKSKRRCDIAFPRCQRCSVKDLICDYRGSDGGATASMLMPSDGQMATPSIGLEWFAHNTQEVRDNVASPLMSRETNGMLFSDAAWPTANSAGLNTEIELPSLALASHSEYPENMQLGDVDGFINTSGTPWEPGDDYTMTGVIYQARVKFAARQLITYPEMFYRRGQTPFIHRHLYEEHIPPVILNALSCSALYCSKNSENESLVFADVSRKAQELAESQQTFRSTLDLLASTQALLIYQIIRLLDGDIRLRADAESSEATCISWTDQLFLRTRSITATDAQSPRVAQSLDTPLLWKDWVFEESCRRTILTSYMLQGVYSFLKLGCDNVSRKINKMSFTAQKALWNAPSEYHWKEALKEKKHFPVKMNDWDASMDGTKPADLDELGVVLLATYKGMDVTCQWLGRENLARWGLD